MRTIRIYDKTIPVLLTSNARFLCALVSLSLFGLWTLLQIEGMAYVGLFLMAFLGVQSILRHMHLHGTFGPISRVTVTDHAVSLFGTTWNYHDISAVTIELWCREIQHVQCGNNYMNILTKNGQVYELAVLIESDKDVAELAETIQLLKKKIRVDYTNRLPARGSRVLYPID
ncbi:MAG TPA: hypothetical protein VGD40_05170 [Chryseosolibacter sp.]